MRDIITLLATIASITGVTAQVASPVPTGTPVSSQDQYAGQYRPQIHFSPPAGFMNDPNGLFKDDDGLWHLYYQYNPTDVVAGNQHWGHATSNDLYHWKNEQIGLFPPSPEVGVFSGSAVVDTNNTSGFFPNQTNGVVAIYTLNYPDRETQDIAYSTDGGYTFTPYESNPVLDIGNANFRDPKVIRYNDKWIMSVAVTQEYVVQFYTSDDLKTWTFASNFTRGGLLGNQYECPNLVQVPVKNTDGSDGGEMWVLVVSINPGGPLGGSTTEYFPGTFNGTHFEPVDGAIRFADWMKDDYAGQFFWEGPGQQSVFIAWASNWQYTNEVPTADEGWRSAMSLPKKVHIQNVTREAFNLVQAPYDLSAVMGEQLAREAGTGSLCISTDFGPSKCNDTIVNRRNHDDDTPAVLLQVNVTNLSLDELVPNAAVNITFLSASKSDSLTLGYIINNWLWLDRGDTTAYTSPLFNDKFSAWYALNEDATAFSLEVVLDRSLIEVFVDNGALLGSSVLYPSEPLSHVDISVGGIGNATVQAGVWALNSVWQ